MSLKSFRDARKAFSTNLNNVLAKLNYTPASLSMKLNNAAISGGSSKSVISASDVQDWTSGKKVPSLYAYFKLCDYLRLTMDDLFNPTFDLDSVVARSFAAQKTTAPKIAKGRLGVTELGTPHPVEIMASDIDNILKEELALLAPYVDETPKSFSITITPADKVFDDIKKGLDKAKIKVPSIGQVKSAEQLRKSLVDKHSISTKRNDKLAYAVLTSGKTVSSVAKSVGVAPRTLRDYMYYGVTVPETVAKALLKLLKVGNYTTLGLKFDSVKTRYTHV